MTRRRSAIVLGTIIIIGIALIVGIRLLTSRHGGSNDAARKTGPVAVETAPVTVGPIVETGFYTGSLKAISTVVIAPKLSGRLEKLHVRLGDTVRNGQLIAELDPGTYEQTLEQARAELSMANAQVEDTRGSLKTAQGDYDAGKTMYANKYISQSDLDALESKYLTAKSKFDIANATVQSKQAAVRAAEIQLGYTRLHATWSGGTATRVVGEKSADEGTLLTANSPIVTILDNSTLIAEIDVVERDYPRLRVGQEAMVTSDACPGQSFPAKVARIAPELNESSRQARVEIDIPNAKGLLKSGMYARVSIEYDHHDNAVTVPLAAIAKAKGKQGVYVIDRQNAKVSFVEVKTGIQSSDQVEIISPALSGEVVTVGREQLSDGRAIILPKPEADGKGEGKSGKAEASRGNRP
jgi:HlyD family secretion protein